MEIKAFLPCRAGSERVPKKNVKPFLNFEYGLIELKLNQLLSCSLINEIILSTDDGLILDYVSNINDSKLIVHKRDSKLCQSSTSTDDLISHALDLIPSSHILWTHVTSPFVDAQMYEKIIRQYKICLENDHDSLMGVLPLQTFLWNDFDSVNYNRSLEKWPRTQTLTSLYEVNSSIFLNSSSNYREFNDRIGKKPYLFKMDKITSHDIDTLEDFILAEAIAKSGLVQL